MKNAYSILGVSKDATQADIIKGQIKAMKERKYASHEITNAQKLLAAPAKRLGVDFIYPDIEELSAMPLESTIKSIDMDINAIDTDLYDSLK